MLITLKEDFLKEPEFSSKAAKFEQEIKKLKDGQYKTTMMLGNSIRKFLNNLFSVSTSSQFVSSKVAFMIKKFEENFKSVDNKTLYEEAKYDPLGAKNKFRPFKGGKLTKSSSMSQLDANRPMTDEEKKELSRSIKNLTAQQLKGIISIVRDMFPEKNGMLEFDIDKLPPYK